MTIVAGEPRRTGAIQPGDEGERILIQSAPLETQRLPEKVLVAPWGEVQSVNGAFVVDEEAATLVIEAFRAHGTDIPIDYEHQSLGGVYASPSGEAPAAGWIRSLHLTMPQEAEGQAGLFAEVRWTEAARRRLSAKEYRYLSPVVLVRKSDRRVVALHSVALTNKPAIVGMKPIVNSEGVSEEKAVGAPAEGGDAREAAELLRHRLGLPQDSDPRSVLLAAEARLASLTTDLARYEASDRVDAAVRAGKLTAAQREWATSLAMKDPQAFTGWLATAPVLVVPGRIDPPGGADGAGRRRSAVISSARAFFRSEPALGLVTSEAAWVQDALREAGLEGNEA